VNSYSELTAEQRERALAHARVELAAELRDYLLGNNREAMPMALRPIIDRFEAVVLARAQTRNYLTGVQERGAVRVD
jgi:hypothetical protein